MPAVARAHAHRFPVAGLVAGARISAKATDAHIIATKQIGDTKVNKPFFQLLTEKARTGTNVDWIPFWKELKQMAQSEDFDDYIPPYKNLGALFIKAYKIATGE